MLQLQLLGVHLLETGEKKHMRVLVGCEESQVVCKAFRDAGHEAYSCDILPTRGNPDWHIQGDVMDAITRGWDLAILHPDCTALAVSGNRWYGKGMPKHQERLDAIEWTADLWWKSIYWCNRVALENPQSVIFPRLRTMAAEVQFIQPWEYGHGEVKKTGIARYNLPPLQPTNVVEGRKERVWRMAPGPNRKRDRSETYQGIADAMVLYWG